MARLLSGMVRLVGRLLGRAMHPSAREVQAPGGTRLDSLARHRLCLLVSRKRDGTLVPTPLAFAFEGDRLVLRTSAVSAKVKRVRRDPDVLVAPCDVRGRPLGGAVAARARVLADPAERAAAERAITLRYGLAGRIWSALVGRARLEAAYLEVR